MRKIYLGLQIKRVMRMFGHILAVTVLLGVILALLLGSILQTLTQSADHQRFRVGITGDIHNSYIQLAKSALESMDSTRFSLEMVFMTEEQAKDAMYKGELTAYAVLPEGFLDAILYGEVRTVRYVTTAGNISIASIVKNEITQMIADLLTCSQKGIYGTERALRANGYPQGVGKHVNAISLRYVDLVLKRSEMYTAEQLGISNGLSLPAYYFCGMTVLFLYILGLPYAVLFIKRDRTLERVMTAKGQSAIRQVLCEATAYVLACFALIISVGGIAAVIGEVSGLFAVWDVLKLCVSILPVAVMITLGNLLIFECSKQVISGVLLQFFATIVMCYAAGCFYPIYTLPPLLQSVSYFLPAGVARGYLSACLTGEGMAQCMLALLVYTILFLAVTTLVRMHRTVSNRG